MSTLKSKISGFPRQLGYYNRNSSYMIPTVHPVLNKWLVAEWTTDGRVVFKRNMRGRKVVIEEFKEKDYKWITV